MSLVLALYRDRLLQPETHCLIRSDEIPVRKLIICRQIFERQIRRAIPGNLARVPSVEFVEATGLHHRDCHIRRGRQPRSNRKARGTASDNLERGPDQLVRRGPGPLPSTYDVVIGGIHVARPKRVSAQTRLAVIDGPIEPAAQDGGENAREHN